MSKKSKPAEKPVFSYPPGWLLQTAIKIALTERFKHNFFMPRLETFV